MGTTAGQRHEACNVTVTISVEREGTDLVPPDTRAFALLAELETQLRSDKTVNGAVTDAEVTDFTLDEFVAADGMRREAQLLVTVNYEHWI